LSLNVFIGETFGDKLIGEACGNDKRGIFRIKIYS